MPDAPSKEFLALQEAVAGRYSLDREIGRGGMGIVFLAHDVALERPVAIKLLPPAFAAQPQLRERFLREARTAAQLSHPNVVPIHAVDQHGDLVFFVMAYVDGETLGHRLRTHGPLPASAATTMLREVAWALAYAHAQGVVHRDVKPDNILLEGGNGRALVTDFGIAHVREQPGMTGQGEVLGTAEFMSPEQASGERVDSRSDIYSLGAVGFFALSGKLPFEGPTVSSVLAQHITQAPPPVASVAPEIPGRLATIIDRCLAKDPGQRFAHGEELAEALSRAVEMRREIPVPLRVFIKHNRESFRASWALVLLLLWLVPVFVVAVAEGEVVPIAILGALLTAVVATPTGMLYHMIRRLLKSGFGRDDLLLALKIDLDRRKEELAFEYGVNPTLIESVARALSVVGLQGFVLGLVSLGFTPDPISSGLSAAVIGISATTGIGAGLIAASRYERRRDVAAQRWLKIWRSRLGRWVFKVAKIGLRRLPGAAPGTYRPTELAIGMAADRLFEELPKEVRKSLSDLPAVVRKLEADAQKMRGRVEDLNGMLAEVGGGEHGSRVLAASPPSGLANQRDALSDDLQAAHDVAEHRLADAVGSLETIRLDLLRMQAGAGSVEGITADLASAKELSDDIERLLEGQEEVEAALKGG